MLVSLPWLETMEEIGVGVWLLDADNLAHNKPLTEVNLL
jgi:hypothetical protein